MSRRSKRRPVEDRSGEETVDDLAYAATFAMMGPPSVAAPTTETSNENDEIDIDDDEDSDGPGENIEESANDDLTSKNKENPESNAEQAREDEDEDDDDDEVELNVTGMLDQMEEELIDDKHGTEEGNKTSAPRTEHEVDAYTIPIQELEKHLQFSLTVDDGSSSKTYQNLNSFNLIVAGRVKHFMIHDRTVVVESNPPVNGASLSPLDEGSLLVVKDKTTLVPLGRIFEVFGPVSQPLYTIRLPAPPASSSISTKPKKDNPSKQTEESKSDVSGTNDSPVVPQNDTVEQETKETVESEAAGPPPTDHWSPNGKYSCLLTNIDEVSVFFVQDESKIIDTNTILRNSGKGCDASNLYDEEVANGDVMYYSDDEKERRAKSRRKGGNKEHQQHRNNTRGGDGRGPVPLGFHQPPPPTGFHNPPPPPSALPQGFHRTTVPPPAYPNAYPTRTSGGPPPPPPRNAPNQPPSYPTGPPAYQY